MQRVSVSGEICKRTPFVINIVEQYVLTKCDANLEDEDMATLLRAVKCAEAWLM